MQELFDEIAAEVNFTDHSLFSRLHSVSVQPAHCLIPVLFPVRTPEVAAGDDSEFAVTGVTPRQLFEFAE